VGVRGYHRAMTSSAADARHDDLGAAAHAPEGAARSSARPVDELCGPIAALLSDVDGTMTQDGRIEADTLQAIETLVAHGIAVVPVTGRSAGFGHTLLSVIPAPAVIAENGGVTFVRDGAKVRKLYGLPEADIASWRHRMAVAVAEVQRELPALRLSTDSAFREVDLALDWNEEVALPASDADRAVELLRAHGLAARRSSVHVNFNPPLFDKRTACLRLVRDVLGGDVAALDRYAYVGDSLNDAPVFAGFPSSVGVANVRDLWPVLPHRPAFVTRGREAVGFRELVAHLLTLPRR
jgi:HAD superfamily hydrolase (TIGR01484 family)